MGLAERVLHPSTHKLIGQSNHSLELVIACHPYPYNIPPQRSFWMDSEDSEKQLLLWEVEEVLVSRIIESHFMLSYLTSKCSKDGTYQ